MSTRYIHIHISYLISRASDRLYICMRWRSHTPVVTGTIVFARVSLAVFSYIPTSSPISLAGWLAWARCEAARRRWTWIRLSSGTTKPQGGAENFRWEVLLSNSFFLYSYKRAEDGWWAGDSPPRVAIHRNITSSILSARKELWYSLEAGPFLRPFAVVAVRGSWPPTTKSR